MSRKIILALLILAVLAIILVLNSTGSGRIITVNLIIDQINALKSLVFLAFIAAGVLIGLLLK